jgi:hypothetical protein
MFLSFSNALRFKLECDVTTCLTIKERYMGFGLWLVVRVPERVAAILLRLNGGRQLVPLECRDETYF